MRELLFKHSTSLQKMKKILTIKEVGQREGIKTRITKKHVYRLKKVIYLKEIPSPPQVYIVKRYNSQKHIEKLLAKIKGSFYALHNRTIFLVYFCHSLEIVLSNQIRKDLQPQKHQA